MNVVIEKIVINSFGQLKNAVFEAKPDINILEAPNESGKTTLAAFLKFAFYGFAGGRTQNVGDNERKRFLPWSGEPAEGGVTFTADGVKYILTRKCLPSGKETFDLVERLTGNSAFPGEVPGEAVFGVSEEVFSRTLFLRQLAPVQNSDGVLAEKLQNIAISADEQVNTAKAVAKLNDAKNELRNKLGNGIIPKLLKNREDLDRQIEASNENREAAKELVEKSESRAKKIEEVGKKVAVLREERRNSEKYDALLKLRNIKRLAAEEEAAQLEYDKVSAGLKKREGVNSAFSELSAMNLEYTSEKTRASAAADAMNKANAELRELESELPFDSEQAEEYRSGLKSKRRISLICAVLAGIAVIGGVIAFIAGSTAPGGVLTGVALVCLAAAAAFEAKRNSLARKAGFRSASQLLDEIEKIPEKESAVERAKARADETKSAYGAVFEKCGALKTKLDAEINKYVDAGDSDYAEAIDSILALSSASGEKFAVWQIKKEELEKALDGVDTDMLAQDAQGAKEPERERSVIDKELNFLSAQYDELNRIQHNDEISIASYYSKSGDPAVLVGKRDACDARVAELELRRKAYETAIAELNEASDEMKSRVAPRISTRANEYFRVATGGKYDGFEVDTKMSMSYGNDFRRSCEYLSAGTRDSAYLCLRLGLTDILFGGNAMPVVLDDAFARIDDDRLVMMARALCEASEKHQIFILTHGGREKKALDSIGAYYTSNEIRII